MSHSPEAGEGSSDVDISSKTVKSWLETLKKCKLSIPFPLIKPIPERLLPFPFLHEFYAECAPGDCPKNYPDDSNRRNFFKFFVPRSGNKDHQYTSSCCPFANDSLPPTIYSWFASPHYFTNCATSTRLECDRTTCWYYCDKMIDGKRGGGHVVPEGELPWPRNSTNSLHTTRSINDLRAWSIGSNERRMYFLEQMLRIRRREIDRVDHSVVDDNEDAPPGATNMEIKYEHLLKVKDNEIERLKSLIRDLDEKEKATPRKESRVKFDKDEDEPEATNEKVEEEELPKDISEIGTTDETDTQETETPKAETSEREISEADSKEGEPETEEVPAIDADVQEASNEEIPEAASETSSKDIPEAVSETSADDVPETISETSKDIPEAVSETSGKDVPEAVSETSGKDVPEAVSETSANDVPEAESETSANDVPEAESETSANDVPEAESETSANDVPEAVSETSGNNVPEAVSETSGNNVPETISEASSKDVPESASETSANDVPETISGTSSKDIPEADVQDDSETPDKEIQEDDAKDASDTASEVPETDTQEVSETPVADSSASDTTIVSEISEKIVEEYGESEEEEVPRLLTEDEEESIPEGIPEGLPDDTGESIADDSASLMDDTEEIFASDTEDAGEMSAAEAPESEPEDSAPSRKSESKPDAGSEEVGDTTQDVAESGLEKTELDDTADTTQDVVESELEETELDDTANTTQDVAESGLGKTELDDTADTTLGEDASVLDTTESQAGTVSRHSAGSTSTVAKGSAGSDEGDADDEAEPCEDSDEDDAQTGSTTLVQTSNKAITETGSEGMVETMGEGVEETIPDNKLETGEEGGAETGDEGMAETGDEEVTSYQQDFTKSYVEEPEAVPPRAPREKAASFGQGPITVPVNTGGATQKPGLRLDILRTPPKCPPMNTPPMGPTGLSLAQLCGKEKQPRVTCESCNKTSQLPVRRSLYPQPQGFCPYSSLQNPTYNTNLYNLRSPCEPQVVTGNNQVRIQGICPSDQVDPISLARDYETLRRQIASQRMQLGGVQTSHPNPCTAQPQTNQLGLLREQLSKLEAALAQEHSKNLQWMSAMSSACRAKEQCLLEMRRKEMMLKEYEAAVVQMLDRIRCMERNCQGGCPSPMGTTPMNQLPQICPHNAAYNINSACSNDPYDLNFRRLNN